MGKGQSLESIDDEDLIELCVMINRQFNNYHSTHRGYHMFKPRGYNDKTDTKLSELLKDGNFILQHIADIKSLAELRKCKAVLAFEHLTKINELFRCGLVAYGEHYVGFNINQEVVGLSDKCRELSGALCAFADVFDEIQAKS